jgi:hypothetical protein
MGLAKGTTQPETHSYPHRLVVEVQPTCSDWEGVEPVPTMIGGGREQTSSVLGVGVFLQQVAELIQHN